MKILTTGLTIKIQDISSKELILESVLLKVEKDRLFILIKDKAIKEKLYDGREILCAITTNFGVRLFESVVIDTSLDKVVIIDYNPDDYKMFQRRKFLRVNANVSAIIIYNNEFFKVKTCDLSGGGIKFYSQSENIPVNEFAQMRIRLEAVEPSIVISGKILKHDYFKENEYLFFFTEINENSRTKIIKKCMEVQAKHVRKLLDKDEPND